jgi:hypothetical protein
VEQHPGSQTEGPGQVVYLVLAWRHAFQLAPLGHPGRANFGQQVDMQFVRKDHGLIGLELLEHPADAGQAVDPLGIIVFGDQLGPLPHPADVMEPAAQGLSRDREAPVGLQGQGQRGTAPARPAPPIRPGGALSRASSDRRNVGSTTVVRTGDMSCPRASRSQPKAPLR